MSMKKFNFDDYFGEFLLIGMLFFGALLMSRACDIVEEAVKSFRYEQPSKSATP